MKKLPVFLSVMMLIIAVSACAAANTVGSFFYNDRAQFEVDGKYGYIDRTGKIVIPAQWDYAEPFYHLNHIRAAVFRRTSPTEGEYAVIDRDGNIVLDYKKCDRIDPEAFYGQYILVHYKQDDGQYVEVYTSDGKLVNTSKWISAKTAGEQYICVQDETGLFGYRDLDKGFMIPCQYIEAHGFTNGLALVKGKNAKGEDTFFYINRMGENVISGDWDYAGDFSMDGYAAVFKGALSDQGLPFEGKYAFIDMEGRLICDYIWDEAHAFEEGLAPVASVDIHGNKKWGFMDADGKLLNDEYWDQVEAFHAGVAVVFIKRADSEDGQYGFIDQSGAYISVPQWDEAENMREGYAVVGKKDTSGKVYKGLINLEGELVIETIWDDLKQLYDSNLTVVSKDGKWGAVNEYGDIVIPVKWDRAFFISEGVATVWEGEEWYIIDTDGNIIF